MPRAAPHYCSGFAEGCAQALRACEKSALRRRERQAQGYGETSVRPLARSVQLVTAMSKVVVSDAMTTDTYVVTPDASRAFADLLRTRLSR